jgi:hypothetical protein
MLPEVVDQPVWNLLLAWLGQVCSRLKGAQPWFVEAHQFRIDTTDGIGRPTPEGAHRDGVDLVAVFMVDRVGVKGGETRVFDAAGPNGQRFTLTEPWSVLLLDDARVVHESTPIQPLVPDAPGGHRDTLVLTFRAKAFQGDDATQQSFNKRSFHHVQSHFGSRRRFGHIPVCCEQGHWPVQSLWQPRDGNFCH